MPCFIFCVQSPNFEDPEVLNEFVGKVERGVGAQSRRVEELRSNVKESEAMVRSLDASLSDGMSYFLRRSSSAGKDVRLALQWCMFDPCPGGLLRGSFGVWGNFCPSTSRPCG